MDEEGNLGTKVASLGARMFGLENTVKGIADTLVLLGNKIDRRGETPWGSIWAACGFAMTVLTVVGAMALTPVKDSITSVASQLNDTNKAVASLSTTFMPKEDIREGFKSATLAMTEMSKQMAQGLKDERLLADQGNRDLAASFDRALSSTVAREGDYQKMNDERAGRLVNAIRDIRDGLVTRGEHMEHWKADDQRFADLQRQIEDNKHHLDSIYGARDVIQDLHKELRDTSEAVWRREGKDAAK